MINEVVFDIETKKLFSDIEGDNPADLEVSIVSLYERQLDENFKETSGSIKSFWEDDFKKMWPIFQKADRIIGFNSLGFDVPALTPHANFPFDKLSHFDLLAKVKEVLGHRLSLDALAKETIGTTKIGVGTDAVKFWNMGDKKSLKLLKEYCEADVIITKDVYDFGLKNKYLKYTDKWNTVREVEVDFSYPAEKTDKKQIGMF
jgi:DEAD/DEAH box helicase domain-containing protein